MSAVTHKRHRHSRARRRTHADKQRGKHIRQQHDTILPIVLAKPGTLPNVLRYNKARSDTRSSEVKVECKERPRQLITQLKCRAPESSTRRSENVVKLMERLEEKNWYQMRNKWVGGIENLHYCTVTDWLKCSI